MNIAMLFPRVRTAVCGFTVAGVLLCPGGLPRCLAKESPGSALDLARQLNQAFIDVAEKASSSVVVIKLVQKHGSVDLDDDNSPFWEMIPREFRKQFEEQREKQRQKQRRPGKEAPSEGEPAFDAQGSGVVVRDDGYILTNGHVVDGAEKIRVRFRDGAEYDATVRGVDPRSDVAVIKIDTKGKKLPVARLGDSEKTHVGEFAIAIGAPFELDYSVTFGHVSAKGRSRIIPDPTMDQDFIQTDANINPGNSGGPLVNIDGEIIGINTLIRGLHTGIGFAIPINFAKEVADQLISEGRYTRSWLGVRITPLKEDLELRDLVTGVSDGVVVTAIQSNGPAIKSDLKASDIITAVDGKAVTTAQELKNEIRSKKVGQSVTLDVHRNGRNLKIKVKTDAWPDDPIQVAHVRPKVQPEESHFFGMKIDPLTKDLAEQYEIERVEGVIVTEVEQGSVAEKKGFRPGDIITEVNQKSINTPNQFRDAIKSANSKKGIIINFVSGGTSKYAVLKQSRD